MQTLTRTTKSTRNPETLTRRDSNGAIFALSSVGGVEYVVDLVAGTCQCAGFTFRRTCRHLVAAQTRYSEPTAEQVAEVVAFIEKTSCHLCGNPFATGTDSRRIGGGGYLDRPICRLGDPGDHAA